MIFWFFSFAFRVIVSREHVLLKLRAAVNIRLTSFRNSIQNMALLPFLILFFSLRDSTRVLREGEMDSAPQSDAVCTTAGIYVLYHCVSMCMFVQCVGTDNRPLSLRILFFCSGLTHTHTHLICAQFLLASVKLQEFRDSKTGTIWSSLPASRFLPPQPPTPPQNNGNE